jgi:hypothetical protein
MTIMTKTDPLLVLDFYQRLAAILRQRDARLEAEAIENSPEVYVLKIRLTTEKAASICESRGVWSLEVLDMKYGEWIYGGGEELSIQCAVPDFSQAVTDDTLQTIAGAIEEMAEDYLIESPDPSDASVREYFKLSEDTGNPTFTEGQCIEGWTGQRGFNEGTIFVVLNETGQPPQLYPAGRIEEAVGPESPIFKLLRPKLLYTPSPFRAVLLEERADPVSILEELIRRGITTYEDVYELLED